MKKNTLVVPIDFSLVSRAVVAEATHLARMLGSRIVLLNVIPPPIVMSGNEPLIASIATMTDSVRAAAQNHLNRYRAKLNDLDIVIETVVRTGSAVREVLAEAKKQSAAYIVIGSHGHNAMYDLIVGSTTSGILQQAKCPVIVVSAHPVRRKSRAS